MAEVNTSVQNIVIIKTLLENTPKILKQ
jgi:hypothetical protein